MFGQLTAKDFAVLRIPLESGRQSPDSVGGILFLGIFLQWLLYFLTYYVAGAYTRFPNIEKVQDTHFWITIILSGLSLLFCIPTVYRKLDKLQYLISIIVSQNLFGVFPYFCGLFLIGEGPNATTEMMITFTYISLTIAIVLFIATSIRFYILLKKGKYREGSTRGIIRSKVEATSYLPFAIIGGLGLFYILQYMIKSGALASFEHFIMTLLFLLIFYAMIFVLPEQLVILYCKFRFKSFTFNERGYLYSEEENKTYKVT
ncbi:ABC transporter ATPase [Bacillus weihaiensis]|uniref:ABC transporter ATPase n=1 Tax=Bacillus weihaiensis TaxID=1547283 RepID=A0A1L3MMD1_9BACI|nr:ABC transporter ATPase [Bacillus weihaiensis]APH03503.1 ABC transporter ATPase [Bacillus weihaiensis]